MADFGGLIRFTYNANPIKIRGKVDIEPTDSQYDVEHNQDGSFDRTVKPMGPSFEIDFVDSIDGVSAGSLPWNDIMANGPYNVTIIEQTTKIEHVFTSAQFVGRVKSNRDKTGLVTGIRGQASAGNYKQVTTSS